MHRTVETLADVRRVPCNRCGDCCEGFYLPKPLELVQKVVDEKTRSWLMDVEPLDEVAPPRRSAERQGYIRYRCLRFERLPDGEGRCTRYEDRPLACSEFPYFERWGVEQAVLISEAHPRCAWNPDNLRVLGFEPVLGVELPV